MSWGKTKERDRRQEQEQQQERKEELNARLEVLLRELDGVAKDLASVTNTMADQIRKVEDR